MSTDVDAATPDLSRVVVVGTSCSGKTTFARDLAMRLAVEHIELDALSWLPGWIERDRDEFLELLAGKVAAETWVTDGNYSRARDLLWSRATTVIWLDYSFPVVLWRAVRRTAYRSATGQEICNGNRETWQKALLSRDSILLWVVTTYHRRRRDYNALIAGDAYPNAAKICLNRPAEAARFLAAVRTPI